jgi:hypothetical protein
MLLILIAGFLSAGINPDAAVEKLTRIRGSLVSFSPSLSTSALKLVEELWTIYLRKS